MVEGYLIKIDGIINFMFTGETETYSYIKQHPTDGSFALVVKSSDLNRIPKDIQDKIGSEIINAIEVLDDSWIVQEEI